MALQPINYNLDYKDPLQSLATGFGQGLQIGNAYQESQLKRQAELQKQQLLQQKQEDLSAFATRSNKTAEDYAAIINQYPDLGEDYKKAWDILDKDNQRQIFQTSSQVYAASKNGDNELAKRMLEEQSIAALNAGKIDESKRLDTLASLATTNPELLQQSVGLFMSATNPDQFASISKGLGEERRAEQLQPFEVSQAGANIAKTKGEIQKQGIENQYLAQEKEAGLQNIESQIEDRTQGRILEKEKMRLQNDQFYQKLDQDQQQFYENLNQTERKNAQAMAAQKKESSEQRVNRLEKAQGYANAAVNAANTAKLANDLIQDWDTLSNSTGAGLWNWAMRNTPGTTEYNFNQKLESLKAQGFLIGAQSLKGMGSLTEAEGAKATTAIANLNPTQNTQQFATQLAELAKAASNIATHSNKQAQIFATKGLGYSYEVQQAAKKLGVSPAEVQKVANERGL